MEGKRETVREREKTWRVVPHALDALGGRE